MIRRSPVAALALALAACAAPPADRGAAAGRPTIVSLNPCTDAILAEVAAPGQLLAISHYSHDPRASSMDLAQARAIPATGGTVEEVLALDPDLVVAGSFLAPATRSALEDLGLRVATFTAAATVEDSIAQVRRLAALAGNPAAGEALVRRIEAAIAAARPEGAVAIAAALWQSGGIVPGEGALVSDLLRRTGFSSYATARGMAQADYLALEQIVADPPALLLVTGRETGQRHPVLDHLPAMRRENLPAQLTYCGGPTIIEAAERLHAIRTAMHPGEGSDLPPQARARPTS